MRRVIGLCLAAVLFHSGAPAQAQQQATVAERANSDMTAYVAWYNKFMQAEQPVLTETGALGGKWRAVSGLRTPQAVAAAFRPTLAHLRLVLNASNADLQALDTPEFGILASQPDLQPRAMVAAQIKLNGQLRGLADQYELMLQAAIRHDMNQVVAAGRGLLHGTRVMLDANILQERASHALLPKDSVEQSSSEVRIALYSSVGMLIDAGPVSQKPHIDTALANRLKQLADRLDATSDEGDRRATATIAKMEQARSEGEAASDAQRAVLAKRVAALIAAERETFVLGHQLAQQLHSMATTFTTTPATFEVLSAQMARITPFRDALLRISQEEADATKL